MCVDNDIDNMPESNSNDSELTADRLPPCRICGETASGFHYGVNSCGACKGFFLRSLSRHEPYSCQANSQCRIGAETKRRKSCQKCRFDKCLKFGMSKDAIKIGRYPYSKRTKDTLELKQLKSNVQSSTRVNQPEILAASSSNGSSYSNIDLDSNRDVFQTANDFKTTSLESFLAGVTIPTPIKNPGASSHSSGTMRLPTNSEKCLYPDELSFYSGSPSDSIVFRDRDVVHQSHGSSAPSASTPLALTPSVATTECTSVSRLDGLENGSLGSSLASDCLLDFGFGTVTTSAAPCPNNALSNSGSDWMRRNLLETPICLGRRQCTSDQVVVDDFQIENVLTTVASASCQSHIYYHPTNKVSRTGMLLGDTTNAPFHLLPQSSHSIEDTGSSCFTPADHDVNLVKSVDSGVFTNESSPPLQALVEDIPSPSRLMSDSISGQNHLSLSSHKMSTSLELDRNNDFTAFLSQHSFQSLTDILDSRMGDGSNATLPLKSNDGRSKNEPCGKAPHHDMDALLQIAPAATVGTTKSLTSPYGPGLNIVELLLSKTHYKSNKTSPQPATPHPVGKLASLKAVLGEDQSHPFINVLGRNSTNSTDVFSTIMNAMNPQSNSKSSSCDQRGEKMSNEKAQKSCCQTSVPGPSSWSSPDQRKPQIWASEFSVSELESWTNHLVNYHKAHVMDNNTHQDMLHEKHSVTSDKFRLEESTFGQLRALDWKLYFEVYQSTGLDVDGRINPLSQFLLGFHNECVTTINFIKKIPGFKLLPMADQAKLVRGSAHEFQLLGVYKGWDSQARQVTFLPLGLTLTEEDMKKMFNQSAFDNHTSMAEKLLALNLNLEQIILLKAIVAVAADREELEAGNAVWQIYWKLVNCLLYLLWKQTTQPYRQFSRIISVLSELRSYSVAIRQAYKDVRSNIEMLTRHIDIPYIYDLFF